jgi:creatinine amidohydrolase/Fe(II)-dependent formamide hydrolase-like protein
MNTQKLGSSQQDWGVVGAAPEEEAAEEVAASGEMHDVPGAEHAIGGEMEFGWRNRGLSASGVPTEPISASTTTAEQVVVGVSY